MKKYTLNLFSEQKEILEEFMEKYYNEKITFNTLKYEKVYENPIDMIELISTLTDNNEKFKIGVWISIDQNIFINVSELNLDKIIRYLLERYPY